MDWVQILQVFCIPAFAYLFYKVNGIQHDLEEFKVEVAKESKNYATTESIQRLEEKIDNLRDLIIDELKGKRTKK
jgi:cob(I)alamin adenosyltransferase